LKLGSERRKPTLQLSEKEEKESDEKMKKEKISILKGSGSFFFLLPS